MMTYRPFLIGDDVPADIASPAYRDFLRHTVIASSLDLMYERHLRNPSFPFPDTKFNPNTGEDLPASQYDTLFTWFLGRGAQAWAAHLDVLSSIPSIEAPRQALEEMLHRQLRCQLDAISLIRQLHAGRVPFRVDRSFRAVDTEGRPGRPLPPDGCNASEAYCATALIAAGNKGEAEGGNELFHRYLDAVQRNAYEDDTSAYAKNLHAIGPSSLALGTLAVIVRREGVLREGGGSEDRPLEAHGQEGLRLRGMDTPEMLAAELLNYLLDNFYDESDQSFCDLIDFATREKQPLMRPGHAVVFIVNGLRVIDAISASGVPIPDFLERSFSRAKRLLPEILCRAFDLGYNGTYHGMWESIDARTGSPINSDLPWWNLPETMRAAVLALRIVREPPMRVRLFEIFRIASNDYFTYYPNPALRFFPFRTRSGTTGKVKHLMPVVTEADPLYHPNLAILDVLALLPRI